MKRTDHKRIEYPEGTSASDRQFCRRLIKEVRKGIDCHNAVMVACSGGIDSTVLAHAVNQGLRLNPYTWVDGRESSIVTRAAYVNHHIRSDEETHKEEEFVTKVIGKWMRPSETGGIVLHSPVTKGAGLQERAREARYGALEAYCDGWRVKSKLCVALMTAHNANDKAETELFNFITGRTSAKGILQIIEKDWGDIIKPLLNFTRADIERYAKCFNLTWCEDASNATDDYTRNKIRHHLIPWIEENVNQSVVKTLAGV